MQVLISGRRRDSITSTTLERVDALHIALTQVVLEGGDLGQIAAELARALGAGVLVTSTDGRERAGAMGQEMRGALDQAGLLDPTGRFRVERAPDYPDYPDYRAEGIPVDPVDPALGEGQVRMLKVVAGGADLARLVCFRQGSEISADDVHAMERAATVAALLITREEAVTAVENKYRGDFLRDVFLGRAGGTDYVVEHASAFGWTLDRPAVVLSAQLDPPGESEEPAGHEQRRRWQERFAAAWRQVVAATDEGAPSVDFSSEVVSVLSAEGAVPDELVRRLVGSVAGDKGGGRRSFSVGVSRVVDGAGALPDAYAQARRALEVGRRTHGNGSTTWFDRLGLHRLIALVPETAELRAFADDVLGELAVDTAEAVDLRLTLQVLLDTNFNVARAARTQFFHYNTMRYRVGKLERILGPLSSDPSLRLDVAVALKVREITG